MLNVEDMPWLRDRRVEDVIIFPFAGYICMAMEACRQQAQWKGGNFNRVTLQHVSVHRPLILSESAVELQLSMTPWNEGFNSFSDTRSHFKVSSWTSKRGRLDHCTGLVAATLPDQQNPVSTRAETRVGLDHRMGDLSEIRNRCSEYKDADHLYLLCDAVGFHYGPTFRRVQDVCMGHQKGTYTVALPDTLTCMPYNRQSDYIFHPISLDGILQGATMFLVGGDKSFEGSYMTVSIREISVALGMFDDPGSNFQIHAMYTPADAFSMKPSFEYVVLYMQRAAHPCGVVIKGVVESRVAQAEIAQEGSKSRSLRTQWEPSMSPLYQDGLDAMLSLPPNFYDTQTSRRLEDMGFDYIKEALHQTSFDKIPATYLQKLYAWMESKMHKINCDFTNQKAYEPNGSISNSKTDDSNGDVAKGQVSIESTGEASNRKVHNEQLLNENTSDKGFPISKVHNQPSGVLTNGQMLERKVPDLNIGKIID